MLASSRPSGRQRRGMALFDTSILLDYLLGDKRADAVFRQHQYRAVSVISWVEVMCVSPEDKHEATRAFLRSFERLSINESIADEALVLVRQRPGPCDPSRADLGDRDREPDALCHSRGNAHSARRAGRGDALPVGGAGKAAKELRKRSPPQSAFWENVMSTLKLGGMAALVAVALATAGSRARRSSTSRPSRWANRSTTPGRQRRHRRRRRCRSSPGAATSRRSTPTATRRRPRRGSIFGKLGLNLRLVREDVFAKQVEAYLAGRSPYLRGTLGMINMAAEVASTRPAHQAGRHLPDDLVGRRRRAGREATASTRRRTCAASRSRCRPTGRTSTT